MEQQYLHQDEFSEEPLTLPHFDDDRTVQSARPVVPLKEVRASNRKRRFLLVGALVIAAGVGAAAASFLYKHRAESQTVGAENLPTATVAGTGSDYVAPSGEASGSSVQTSKAVAITEPTETSEPARASDDSVVEVNKQNTVPVKRTNPRPTDRDKAAAGAQTPADQGYWDDEMAQEAQRRRGRREARRAKRERRAERRNADETTRIREIFEGNPRP